MFELMAQMGRALAGWVTEMTLATGLVLIVAVVLDRALASRVSAAMRLVPYLAVVLRVALPLHWPAGVVGVVERGVGRVVVLPAVLVEGTAGSRGGLVAAVYLAGVAVLLARWLAARWRIARSLAGAWPARGEVAALASPVVVLEHPGQGPLVAGILRPRIVIPLALAESSEALLGPVLRHEAAHVARRDPLLMTALQLALVVAWPVLPLWLAVARVSVLVELACDERAVAGAEVGERRRYGEVLLALATGGAALAHRAAVPSFGWALPARLRALRPRALWGRPVQVALVTALAVAALTCAGTPPDEEEQPADDPSPEPLSTDQTPIEVSVNATIRRLSPAIKVCYEQTLRRDPDLRSGRVNVSAKVAPDGAVTSVGIIASTFRSPMLETCLVNVVSKATFPAPGKDGMRVEFPLVLAGSL